MPELKLLDSYLGKEIAKKLDMECLRDKSVLKDKDILAETKVKLINTVNKNVIKIFPFILL